MGVTTQNEKQVFLHVVGQPANPTVFIPGNYNLSSGSWLNNGQKASVQKVNGGIQIDLSNWVQSVPDQILVLEKSTN